MLMQSSTYIQPGWIYRGYIFKREAQYIITQTSINHKSFRPDLNLCPCDIIISFCYTFFKKQEKKNTRSIFQNKMIRCIKKKGPSSVHSWIVYYYVESFNLYSFCMIIIYPRGKTKTLCSSFSFPIFFFEKENISQFIKLCREKDCKFEHWPLKGINRLYMFDSLKASGFSCNLFLIN